MAHERKYKIVRVYERRRIKPELIEQGVTLEVAMAHVGSPEANSTTATLASSVARTEKKGNWREVFMPMWQRYAGLADVSYTDDNTLRTS